MNGSSTTEVAFAEQGETMAGSSALVIIIFARPVVVFATTKEIGFVPKSGLEGHSKPAFT